MVQRRSMRKLAPHVTASTLCCCSLFFQEACKLRPVQVSLLGMVSPFCTSLASIAAQWVSHW